MYKGRELISDRSVSEHEADLDAHTYNFAQILMTGRYFQPILVASGSTRTLVADTLYAIPLLIARALTIDTLLIEVTSAGAGGTKARLGIYNNGTNLYPGTLLVDVGLVDVDGVTAVAAVITGDQALTKGLYHLAIISDGTPTIRGCFAGQGVYGCSASNPRDRYNEWAKASVGYGALPATFTAGGTTTAADTLLIVPKLKSLD